MSHNTYEWKDEEMPDCTICLVSFNEADQLVVFSCDKKHYFHESCGAEWLSVKTECPLCRFEFSEEIKEARSNNPRSRDQQSELDQLHD